MSRYLSLQIPTPCHENWDKMKPEEKGRFCDSCQKCVMDFTNYTDAQLAQFFKKNKSDVCGRFREEQLDTDIEIPKKRIPWVRYFFQVTMPAFLFSYKAKAQIVGEVAINNKTETSLKHPVCSSDDKQSKREIKGHVVDSSGDPIAYASITFKETQRGVSADSLGKFSIEYKNSNEKTLIISSAGYETKEVSVNTSRVVILKRSASTELTPVVIDGGYYYKGVTKCYSSCSVVNGSTLTTITSKRRDRYEIEKTEIGDISFLIYPNPALHSSHINIKWSKPVNGNQSVLIYDMSQRLVQKKDISVNNSSIMALQLNNLPSGTYVIKIIDEKTGRSSSQKFIVE